MLRFKLREWVIMALSMLMGFLYIFGNQVFILPFFESSKMFDAIIIFLFSPALLTRFVMIHVDALLRPENEPGVLIFKTSFSVIPEVAVVAAEFISIVITYVFILYIISLAFKKLRNMIKLRFVFK